MAIILLSSSIVYNLYKYQLEKYNNFILFQLFQLINKSFLFDILDTHILN